MDGSATTSTVSTKSPVRVFLQGGNTWIEAADLPVPGTVSLPLMLGADGSLTREPAPAGSVRYEGDPRVGVSGALFDPQATGLGYPLEQSVDNLRSACFASTPLESDLDILGPIEAQLHVSLEEGTDSTLLRSFASSTQTGLRASWRPAGSMDATGEGMTRTNRLPPGTSASIRSDSGRPAAECGSASASVWPFQRVTGPIRSRHPATRRSPFTLDQTLPRTSSCRRFRIRRTSRLSRSDGRILKSIARRP